MSINLQNLVENTLEITERSASIIFTLACGYGVIKVVQYMSKEDKNARSNLSDAQYNTGKNILIEHDNVGQSALASIADGGYKMINEATFNRFAKRLKEIKKEFGDESVVHVHLRTPGGELFFAMQIAHMISEWKGPVIAHIHAYSASGGTLIALACNEIHMDAMSVLGPIDPQVPKRDSTYSATDFIQLFGIDPTKIDDKFDCKPFMLPFKSEANTYPETKEEASVGGATENKKADIDDPDGIISTNLRLISAVNLMRYYKPFVERVLRKKNNFSDEQIACIVKNLLTDRDHSSPLWRETCKEIGLNVVFVNE